MELRLPKEFPSRVAGATAAYSQAHSIVAEWSGAFDSESQLLAYHVRLLPLAMNGALPD